MAPFKIFFLSAVIFHCQQTKANAPSDESWPMDMGMILIRCDHGEIGNCEHENKVGLFELKFSNFEDDHLKGQIDFVEQRDSHNGRLEVYRIRLDAIKYLDPQQQHRYGLTVHFQYSGSEDPQDYLLGKASVESLQNPGHNFFWGEAIYLKDSVYYPGFYFGPVQNHHQ